jgi:hypothetical protein
VAGIDHHPDSHQSNFPAGRMKALAHGPSGWPSSIMLPVA